MTENNSGLGCLIGFIVLGVMILFYNRIMFFSPMFMTIFIGIIAVCILISMIGIKSSHEGKAQYKKSKTPINYQNTLKNPYVLNKVQDSNSRRIENSVELEDIRGTPKIAHYCQFCGVKRDVDAIYCHNCGTRLDLE